MRFTVENGIIFAQDVNEILQIEAWGADALRVRATANRAFSGKNQGLLAGTGRAAIEETEDAFVITNGHLSARLAKTGWLEFFKDGRRILKEYWRHSNRCNVYALPVRMLARSYKPLGGGDYALAARFEGNPDEKIFGMGQYQQPELELKGCVLELAPKNAQASIPFYLSNLGYGFLWNNPAIGTVSFGKNYTEWRSDRTSELDYWITAGNTPKDILRNYTQAVGRAPDFPDELLGLWQCKLRYRTQEEVLEVAREYHRRGLPLDVIVIDFYHWRYAGDWSFDPDYWPDPAAMVQELKQMGTRCMVSVWPTIEPGSTNYTEFAEKRLMIQPNRMPPCIYNGSNNYIGTTFVDTTNPETRKLLWEKCKDNYFRNGIEHFWLDVAEPELFPADFDTYTYAAGNADKTAGLYSRDYAKAFYEGMLAAGQEKPVNLIRCVWVGSQRYGAVAWSGDINSNFENLRAQLSAGLNTGIAGIPWWTTDTAGFFGNVEDPSYNELLIRWFQFSTFCPVLRLHGDLGPKDIPVLSDNPHSGGFVPTGRPHELWSHGEDVYEILKHYLEIRIAMKPYLKELMVQAHEDGSPLLRTMFYEFPEDPVCWDLDDQYMFGEKYLVAPVMYEGMRERCVYLPAGTWKDIHSGTVFCGGQTISTAAPLEIIPVFERL